MIIEFLGNSGSGKTTIIENYIEKESNEDCFFCDAWWYSKGRIMNILIIPYLFNNKVFRLINISFRVLKDRGIKGTQRLRRIRHLVFHYIIALKASTMSNKGKLVLLSESFSTLIPNMFVNNYPKEQKEFTDILGQLMNRSMYIYIENDMEQLMRYKATRDHETDIKKTRDYLINQRINLDRYISEERTNDNIYCFEYDYTNDSLNRAVEMLEELVHKNYCNHYQ